MPLVQIFQNSSLNISLPINLASRTVFRFYSADNNGNQTPLTGFTTAVFTIYPLNQPVVDIPMQIQANGDVVMSLNPNFWAFGTSINDCAIFLDNDYVPFVSGTVAFGIVIEPNQAFAIMNASRNAALINNVQYENPAYVDSSTAQFTVTVDSITGVATVEVSTKGGVWYTGNGAPSNTLGANGDFYFDTLNFDLYGPKAAGVWPAPVSFVTDADLTAALLTKQDLNNNLTQLSNANIVNGDVVFKSGGLLTGEPAIDLPISTLTQDALNLKQDISEKGQPNGYPPLDNNAKVPMQFLPSSSFPVTSVFGRTGDVTAQNGDYTKAQVGLSNVPNIDTTNAANISSGVLPDTRIQQSGITQYQAALTITESQVTNLVSDLASKQDISQKGSANGYAPLDGSSKVPLANLPDISGGINFVTYDSSGTPSPVVATTGDELITLLDAMPIGIKYIYVPNPGQTVIFAGSPPNIDFIDVVIIGQSIEIGFDVNNGNIAPIIGIPRTIAKCRPFLQTSISYDIPSPYLRILDLIDGSLGSSNGSSPLIQVSTGSRFEINFFQGAYLTGPEGGFLININGGDVALNIYTDTGIDPVSSEVFSGSAGNLVINDYRQNGTGSITTSGFSGTTIYNDYRPAQSGANTDITSIKLNQTGLVVKGATANGLTIKPNETLSAGRDLNIITGDADRTLTLNSTGISGNATTATTLQTGRTIAVTGDLSYTSPSFDGSGNVTAAGTLATVNSNVGSFGGATTSGTFTVNGKGLITAASSTSIQIAESQVTNLTTDLAGKASNGANTDITSVVLNQTGLTVKGSSANALTIKPNETLSTGRTLSIVTNDASRSLTIAGDSSVNGTFSGTSSGTNTGDQTTITGAQIISLTNSNAGSITKGMAVYNITADHVDLSRANAIGTVKPFVGLVSDASISASGSGFIATNGPLTVADWTAVVGSATLTSGSDYFVSATTAGHLTATAPGSSGNIVQKVGYAINTTTMMIRIEQPITLA